MTADSTCEVREMLEALAFAEVLGVLSSLPCVLSWLGFPFGWGLLSLPMGSFVCRRVWCPLPHSPQIGLNWQSWARWPGFAHLKQRPLEEKMSYLSIGEAFMILWHFTTEWHCTGCCLRRRNHNSASFLWFCHRGEEWLACAGIILPSWSCHDPRC